MSLSKSIDLFTARPLSSLVLAVLLVVLGVVAVSGLVPRSASRTYLAGHEWLLAGVCWLMAALFAFCAVRGWRLLSRRGKK